MARHRTGSVRETLLELISLRDSLARQQDRARVTMLMMIATDPTTSTDEIATRIDVSPQSVKRWWSMYRRGGVAALLRSQTDETPALSQGSSASGRSDSHWLGFLNALPTNTSVVEWIEGFQRALTGLFDDVDRVSASVNTMCNLTTPESYAPKVTAMDFADVTEAPRIVIDAEGEDEILVQRLRDFSRRGFPVADFHPPLAVRVMFAGTAYLGSLFFWRHRSRPKIGEETVATIHGMKGFFEFVMSDAVARIRLAQPVIGEFDEAFNAFVVDIGLSRSQLRVALLLVQGHRQEEIARSLDLSVNTVRTHLQAIYERAGVSSAHEFIARYATPRFGGRKK